MPTPFPKITLPAPTSHTLALPTRSSPLPQSQREAAAPDLRLRRSHVHRERTDEDARAAVDAVDEAGGAAGEDDVGDAEAVVYGVGG